MMIHVVMAIYDKNGNYCRHAGAAITSIFCNTKESIVLHIICDNSLNKENKEKFLKLAEEFSQKIDFRIVNIEKYIDITKCKFIENYSKASIYRLFVTDMLTEIDKAIYLDCDVIVNMDIVELWKEKIEGYPIGAINYETIFGKDVFNKDKRRNFEELSRIDELYDLIGNEKYFNSGVLILNLIELRKMGNLVQRYIEFFQKHTKVIYPDQDVLNFFFQKKYLSLDAKYNYIINQFENNNYVKKNRECKKIIHYAQRKPWHAISTEYDSFYWQYLYRSPWGGILETSKFIGELCPLEETVLEGRIFSKKSFFLNLCRRFLNFLYKRTQIILKLNR